MAKQRINSDFPRWKEVESQSRQWGFGVKDHINAPENQYK